MTQPAFGEFLPLGQRIRAAALRHPNKIALRDEHLAVTYNALVHTMDVIGAALRRDGIVAGDIIGICAANSVEYATLYLGAANAGVAIALFPQSATAESLCKMIADSEAKIIFADDENRARLTGASSAIVPLNNLEADWLKGCVADSGIAPVQPEAVFNIIYSSGTTGTPKGIMQSHAMRNAHLKLGATCGYDENAVTLLSTPLYSNTTLISLIPTLGLGGTAILMRKFDIETFLTAAQNYHVTHAMLVPIQYQRLLGFAQFSAFDLSTLTHKFCTSAPFTADLKREILARWPGSLIEFYGMTEGGALCILAAHDHPGKLHTVGKPSMESDMRIIDENANELPNGEAGEIVGSSAIMMTGYHNRPNLTDQAYWRSPQGRLYMRTGDIGRFDEDGFLVLLDRQKDVIISGGFNIYPSDLEEVIRTHPAVDDVAVIGTSSEKWGETPIAYVVAHGETAEAIKAFANDRLGKFQRLANVYIVDRLPRNQIGKILKRELRNLQTP